MMTKSRTTLGPVDLTLEEYEKLLALWREKRGPLDVIEPGEEVMGQTFAQPMAFDGFETVCVSGGSVGAIVHLMPVVR